MKLETNKPISIQLQELVRMELTTDTINSIGRNNGFQNGYAAKLFEGNINISERNKDLILEVVKESIKCRTVRFPNDV